MDERKQTPNERYDLGNPNDCAFQPGTANFYNTGAANTQENFNTGMMQAPGYLFNVGEHQLTLPMGQDCEGAVGFQPQHSFGLPPPRNPTLYGQQQAQAQTHFHDSALEYEHFHSQRHYFLQQQQQQQSQQQLAEQMKNGDDVVNLEFFNQALPLNSLSQSNATVGAAVAAADVNANYATYNANNIPFQLPDMSKPPPPIYKGENMTNNDNRRFSASGVMMTHGGSGEPGASYQQPSTARNYENMPLKSWRPPLEFKNQEEVMQSEREWNKYAVNNVGNDIFLLEIDHALSGVIKQPTESSMKEYLKAAENYSVYGKNFFDFMPTKPPAQAQSAPSSQEQPIPPVPNRYTSSSQRRARLSVFANMTKPNNNNAPHPPLPANKQGNAIMSDDGGDSVDRKSFKFTKAAFPPLPKPRK